MTAEKRTNAEGRLLNPGEIIGPPRGRATHVTLLLFLTCVGVFVGACGLALSGEIPLYVATVTNVIALYVLYTPVHEAAHRLAHKKAWVNEFIGWTGAAVMGMSFPSYRRGHFQHHRFTNDLAADPDAVLAGDNLWTLPLRLVQRLTYDHVFAIKHGFWKKKRRHLYGYIATIVLQIAIVTSCLLSGAWREVMALWLVPMVVSGLALFLLFAWLVHHPHDPRQTTRNLDHWIFQLLMIGQAHHAKHHLLPNVVWFRYRFIHSRRITSATSQPEQC